MNFNDQIALIRAASGDPKQLALAVLEILLADRPTALRRALMAAAIPRWFDRAILEHVLDPDLKSNASYWLEQLRGLGCVELFEARSGWNVHETTRLALREGLQGSEPARMAEMARRALSALGGWTQAGRIETTYHRVVADLPKCYEALRDVDVAIRVRPEDGLSLAQALQEYVASDVWPSITRAWSLLIRAQVLEPYRPVGESVLDYTAAEELLRAAGCLAGAAWSQQGLATSLLERGRPGDAAVAHGLLEQSLASYERLRAENPGSPQAARDVSVSLNSLGDFLSRRGLPGDAEKALGLYQRSLDVRERQLAANPESAQAARDVSVSLQLLGDFLASRGLPGDAEKALGHCRRSLEVRERLLAENSESAQAARDVSVSLERLGDFLVTRGLPGDAEKALAYYQRDLEISERLLATSPESSQAARDVCAILVRLGEFLASRGLPGDAEKALGHCQRSLEVSKRLLTSNPESAQAARDVSMSLSKLGDSLASRGHPGDQEKALGHYQRSLEVSERLLAANPDSAEALRHLSLSLMQLGDFLASRGLPGDAEKVLFYYQRDLEISERLLAANPENAEAARDVSLSLMRLGDFLASRGLPGDAEKALDNYQRGLAVSERLLAANPDSAKANRDVLVSLERMAKAEGERPGRAGAASTLQARSLEIALKLKERNPQSYYFQRTAAVSYLLTSQRARAAGQTGRALQCLTDCFSLLDALARAGIELDPVMCKLHSQLKSKLRRP